MYIYTEDYNFFEKKGFLAILCNEIKPHLSDIFYDKFPGFDKLESLKYDIESTVSFNKII